MTPDGWVSVNVWTFRCLDWSGNFWLGLTHYYVIFYDGRRQSVWAHDMADVRDAFANIVLYGRVDK